MNTPDKTLPKNTKQNFPVVGIGASAGGLDAFKKIVKAIPANSGMAYVIVQHLSPDYESNLPKILAQQDYHNFLRNDKAEQDFLFNDILIPVTYFFRDDNIFESLHSEVFPSMIENAVNNNIRIWVAGCATGEEAFSIAILIHEYLLKTGNENMRVQIFASDISEKSIAKARTAIYSAQDIQQISETRLQNYFSKKGGSFHINKVIRDMCIFAVHNFIKDPPFAKIDLVLCRNVLIYLDSYLQKKAMETFHYSLKEKGFLFLGKSESATNVPNLFEPLSKAEKIYTSKHNSGRYSLESFKTAPKSDATNLSDKNSSPSDDFRKIASDILFSKYSPVGVIINEHHEIVHFHGDNSPFLLPQSGKATFNILKMAREGISFELRHTLLQIKEKKALIAKEDLTVKNQSYRASFEVVPINNTDNHIMVLFYKKEIQDVTIENKSNRKTSDQQRIKDLEKELLQLNEDLKRLTDEQHIAFEELQTTNEELHSRSEELQALNEEMETSSEELQSNNEELLCVNDELLDRQEQLIALQNYSESIINTIHEPLLIVNTDFMVKSANPAFYKFFNSTEATTEGQNFFGIGECQWNIPELRQQLTDMLTARIPIKKLKIETLCPGIGKKIMLVNADHIIDAKPSGMILLVLEDITDITSTNNLLIQKNEQLQKYNDQLESFSTAASHDLQDPLRKIHMFCNKIIENDKGLSESTKHDLDRMKFSINNMSQLITDLIGYSRINFIEKEYKKTDLNTLLNKTLRNLRDDISETNTVVNFSSLPVLNVIPYQIQQLFSNLIMNSIKYTKEGTIPEITIEKEEPSADEIMNLKGVPKAHYIKIKISDNGIGFSQEYEDKIFQPFYRLHIKNNYKGSGLGLALVKKIIVNHNGFIKVVSKVNKGSQFSIYFPSSK